MTIRFSAFYWFILRVKYMSWSSIFLNPKRTVFIISMSSLYTICWSILISSINIFHIFYIIYKDIRFFYNNFNNFVTSFLQVLFLYYLKLSKVWQSNPSIFHVTIKISFLRYTTWISCWISIFLLDLASSFYLLKSFLLSGISICVILQLKYITCVISICKHMMS